MKTKLKSEMSLAFLLLAIYVIFSISDTCSKIIGVFDVISQGFPIRVIIDNLLTMISGVIPIALIILLCLNKKKDVKKIAQFILLIASVVNGYCVFGGTVKMLRYIIGGNILGLLQLLHSTISVLVLCVLQIMGFLSLKSNQKKEKMGKVATIGCIVYCLTVFALVLDGKVAVWGVILNILLIMGTRYFPDTIILYSNAKMAKGNIGKIIMAIAMVLFVSLMIKGGGYSGNNDTCGYCHREYTDSANLKSIARTKMCSNCAGNYKTMRDALNN